MGLFDQFAQAAKKAAAEMPKGSGSAAPRLSMGPILAIGGAFALYNSLFNVSSGQHAVKFNAITGMSNKTYTEGTHVLFPWLEKAICYNVRQTIWQTTSQTGSRDLQTVALTVRVTSRPDSAQLVQIHRLFGQDYIDRIMPSICNETLRAVVAKFNASELLTKRPEVSGTIARSLTARARDFGIIIEDVSLTHLTFSKEYRDAVEAKQIAEQEAGRAKFKTEQAIQEKKAMEVLAEGEAQSAKLIGNAVRGHNGYLLKKRYEAAREIAGIVSASKAQVVLPSESLLQDSLTTAAAPV